MTKISELSLLEIIDSRFHSFVSKIPVHILTQLEGEITWAELVDENEIQFGVSVLELTSTEINVAVSSGPIVNLKSSEFSETIVTKNFLIAKN